MLARLNSIVRAIRLGLARKLRRPAQGDLLFAEGALARVQRARRAIGIAALVGAAGWVLLSHPPLQSAGPGEVGVRTNLFTGSVLNRGWVKRDMGGRGAPTPVEESAAGLIRVIDAATHARNGAFLNYTGEEYEW